MSQTAFFDRLARDLAAEAGGFVGGPRQSFEAVGRDALLTLVERGLAPAHNLLDFGCGPLRVGYWLVRFLDPGRYHGIEPDSSRVEAGKRVALTPELIAFKKPRFADNEDCDMGVFETTFDFVIARSVFTHMTPGLLSDSLTSFRDNSSDEGLLLASYWRSQGTYAPRKATLGDELANDDRQWLQTVTYSFGHIRKLADDLGLEAEELSRRPLNRQVWLCFRKT